jgi:hypothetical protein
MIKAGPICLTTNAAERALRPRIIVAVTMPRKQNLVHALK